MNHNKSHKVVYRSGRLTCLDCQRAERATRHCFFCGVPGCTEC